MACLVGVRGLGAEAVEVEVGAEGGHCGHTGNGGWRADAVGARPGDCAATRKRG